MSQGSIATTSGRRIPVVPTRDDLVDALFLVALLVLALIGFRTTFSGGGYLVAGLAGVALGLLLAHLANALRQPMIAVAAMTVAVFFLLGGAVALRGSAIGGVLPTGSTLHALADQSVHGWKDLLTTLPPVDGAGPLLVLPYILGLFGGAGGFCLARRTRPALAPVASPFLVLVMVILLGSQMPAARLLQGAVFGVVALAWTALRAQRGRPPLHSGSAQWMRFVTIAVLLLVSAGAAVVVGPHVPGTGSHKRLVLRNYVEPPFDVRDYPSPLAAFRRYAVRPDKNQILFDVHGLPKKTPVRIATLDDYNGITWTASNRTSVAGQVPDTFQRVGSVIDNPSSGRPFTYEVHVKVGGADTSVRLPNVWLPQAGALTAISFHGAGAAAHADFFRYNLSTGTGVVPDRLVPGDSFTARAVPAYSLLQPTDNVATGASALTDAGAFLHSKATEWAGSSANPTEQVRTVARKLRATGKYSNGGDTFGYILPGHYRKRLSDFVNSPQNGGDDEQFAATFALLVNELGTPARVVVGAIPAADGSVRGRNIHAWVEVQLVDGSWREIPTSSFMNTDNPPTKLPPQQQQKSAGQLVPPPARGKPRSDLDDSADAAARTAVRAHDTHHPVVSGGGIPAWVVTTVKWVGTPLLSIAVVCGLIIAAKALRRRRRRTRGTPAARFSRGWREIVDHAYDLGQRLPSGTRKEQAAVLGAHDARGLARTADAFVFGPSDPNDSDAAQFWCEVKAARRAMSRTVGRGRRVRAALNLATFRPARGGSA